MVIDESGNICNKELAAALFDSVFSVPFSVAFPKANMLGALLVQILQDHGYIEKSPLKDNGWSFAAKHADLTHLREFPVLKSFQLHIVCTGGTAIRPYDVENGAVFCYKGIKRVLIAGEQHWYEDYKAYVERSAYNAVLRAHKEMGVAFDG